MGGAFCQGDLGTFPYEIVERDASGRNSLTQAETGDKNQKPRGAMSFNPVSLTWDNFGEVSC